jgi:cyclophilin family peptidyl-prolyl cis-trans isomerase
MAAFSLGEIENEKALPGLLKSVQNENEEKEVKARCIEALGKIGANKQAAASIGKEKLQEIAKTIASCIDSQSKNVISPESKLLISLGLTALQRLKQEDSIKAMANQLDSENTELRAEAANALTRSKLNFTFACSKLLRNLNDSDPLVRINAARALGAAKDTQASNGLVSRLSDPDTRVVCSAVLALGEIASPSSCVSLVELGDATLTTSEEKKRVSKSIPAEQNLLLLIATAVGNIKDNRALPFLQKARFSCSPYGRAPEVEIALAKFGESAFFNENEKWPQLIDKKHWQSAAAFAQGAGELKTSNAEECLLKMLEDKLDSRALPDVLNSLAACKTKNLKRILMKELANKDVVVRATAASLLADMGDDSADVIDALQNAYSRARDENMNDARLSIIEACDKLKHSMSRKVLSGNSRDKDYVVRRRAFDLLKESGADTSGLEPGKVGSGHDWQYWKKMSRLSSSKNPRAIVHCEKGPITLELFATDAQMTVNNFIVLAKKGYFDKLTFMRVVPNFVVQGGDPRNDMNGGPGYQIRCEINSRRYETGSLGMALSGKDTGGSQFFITHAPQPHLDGGYTCFGKVVDGMELLSQIARGEPILHVEIVQKEDVDAKD